jgi:hypothetical protein
MLLHSGVMWMVAVKITKEDGALYTDRRRRESFRAYAPVDAGRKTATALLSTDR